LDKQTIDKYDAKYAQELSEKIDADEALRYEAMKPLRDFVMNNYQLAEPNQFVKTRDGRLMHRMFTENVLFVLK
jgi:flagellar biosynthesis protein FliP